MLVTMTSVVPLPMPCAVMLVAQNCRMAEPAIRVMQVLRMKPLASSANGSSSKALRMPCGGRGRGGGLGRVLWATRGRKGAGQAGCEAWALAAGCDAVAWAADPKSQSLLPWFNSAAGGALTR
jgi:hypothetical protein